MDRAMFQAYLITCIPSGRRYVGITRRTLNRRWNEHVHDARKRPIVIEAVQWFKHGDHPAVIQRDEFRGIGL